MLFLISTLLKQDVSFHYMNSGVEQFKKDLNLFLKTVLLF